MDRRQIIRGVAALAALLLAAGAAWQAVHRLSVAAAGVSALPDLSRWPPELKTRLEQAGEAARRTILRPVALGQLAELYCANGYAAEGGRALAALRTLDPANARWPYLQADLRLRAGDDPGAEEALRATVERSPRYAPAWLRLGELQARRGAVDLARQSFAAAVAGEPGSIRAQFALISFEVRQGHTETARHRLAEWSRLHPQLRDPHELLADVHVALRDEARAQEQRQLAAGSELVIPTDDAWLDALDDLSYDSSRLMVRSVAMQREGRLDAAEAVLRRVAALAPLEPANPLVWELLSDLYLKREKPDAARATLEAAVAAFPDEPRMHLLLARLLCRLQQPETALTVIGRALARWPDQAELHAAGGMALRDAGRHDAAVAALREALRLDRTLTAVQYQLGASLLELGQRDAARESLRKTLAMRPDFPEALFALAALELDDGNAAAAEPLVFKVHALDPTEPNARQLVAAWHLLRGFAASQTGDLDDAHRHYQDGLALAPDYPVLLREAARLAERRAERDAALKTYAHYLRLKPADHEAWLAQGLLQRETGQAAAARASFERGLALAQEAGDRALEERFRDLLGAPRP